MIVHRFHIIALLAVTMVAVPHIAAPARAQGAAPPARSDWDVSDFSRVRLLLSPATQTGAGNRVDGGVEIQLEPGWHTYWRVPGDAGVPPQFDFSGSQNIADVTVHYPVPERYDDGASISVVYKDRVVFPLTIEPADPKLPVTLAMGLFYGACAEVCIPVKASRIAALAPGSKPDPLARIAIAEFRRKLPEPAAPGFQVSSVVRETEALLINAEIPPATDKPDLFSEGPADWYLGQPSFVSRSGDRATFRLSLGGVPADAKLDGVFNFLLVADQRGALSENVAIAPAD